MDEVINTLKTLEDQVPIIMLSSSEYERALFKTNEKYVPIWHKTLLTLEEAAQYTGIGINKLRTLSSREDCKFVIWNGSKRLLKRRILDEYLESIYSM